MDLPEMYFSIDIRANGPIPGEYSMTAIGVAVVGKPALVYYAELKPISDNVDPETERASGLPMAHLLENGQDPVEAMQAFSEWVQSVIGNTCKPVLVGWDAAFDWMFLNWYLIRLAGSNPFGVSGIDIRSYYMGLATASLDKATVQDAQVLFPTNRDVTNNALDHAVVHAELFEQMLQMQHRRPARPGPPRP